MHWSLSTKSLDALFLGALQKKILGNHFDALEINLCCWPGFLHKFNILIPLQQEQLFDSEILSVRG